MGEMQVRNALGIPPGREHTGGKWRVKCSFCGNWYPDEDYIVVRVWRPSDWAEIEATLAGKRQEGQDAA